MQHYDENTYTVYLEQVAGNVPLFLKVCNIETSQELKEELLRAAYLRDIIEDTANNYADIKNQFSKFVANIVYACSDEKGKTRKERKSSRYYTEIVETPYACFIKLCDLIANMEYGAKNSSGMLDKYLTEREMFVKYIEQSQRQMSQHELA